MIIFGSDRANPAAPKHFGDEDNECLPGTEQDEKGRSYPDSE